MWLVFAYIISSMISYIGSLCSALLYSYDFVNVDTDILNFFISVLVVTIIFTVLGIIYKEKVAIPVILMLIVNVILLVFMFVLEGSYFNLFFMFIDLIFVYAIDFFYYISYYTNLDYNISVAIAFMFSCIYPLIIFMISRLLINIISKNRMS